MNHSILRFKKTILAFSATILLVNAVNAAGDDNKEGFFKKHFTLKNAQMVTAATKGLTAAVASGLEIKDKKKAAFVANTLAQTLRLGNSFLLMYNRSSDEYKYGVNKFTAGMIALDLFKTGEQVYNYFNPTSQEENKIVLPKNAKNKKLLENLNKIRSVLLPLAESGIATFSAYKYNGKDDAASKKMALNLEAIESNVRFANEVLSAKMGSIKQLAFIALLGIDGLFTIMDTDFSKTKKANSDSNSDSDSIDLDN